MQQEYRQDQLPAEVFGAGNGEVRNYQGQDVKVINTGRGTRLLQPLTQNDYISQAIDLQKKANQPAVQSLEASKPEIQSAYQQSRQTLTDRYQNLLDSIRGQGEQDVNRQTTITSNELGKRGIVGSSTLGQQEIQNATSPLRQKYTGLEKDASISQNEQLSGLTTQETADLRAIANSIAQLQSGAAQTGISQGIGQYQQNTQNYLAQQQAQADAKAREVANSIAQAQLALQQQEAKNPVFNQIGSTLYALDPATGNVINSVQGSTAAQQDNGLSSLLKAIGFGSTGSSSSSGSSQPYPIGSVAGGKKLYSDGSIK